MVNSPQSDLHPLNLHGTREMHKWNNRYEKGTILQ